MDVGRGESVGEAAAAAGGEGHWGHVVGEGVGAALIGDEAQVAAVHVGVADEGAKGPQAGGGVGGAGGDVAGGGELVGEHGPGAVTGAEELGVEGGEGDEGAAPQVADAVKAFDFEVTLAVMVDDPPGGGGVAGAVRGRPAGGRPRASGFRPMRGVRVVPGSPCR